MFIEHLLCRSSLWTTTGKLAGRPTVSHALSVKALWSLHKALSLWDFSGGHSTFCTVRGPEGAGVILVDVSLPQIPRENRLGKTREVKSRQAVVPAHLLSWDRRHAWPGTSSRGPPSAQNRTGRQPPEGWGLATWALRNYSHLHLVPLELTVAAGASGRREKVDGA